MTALATTPQADSTTVAQGGPVMLRATGLVAGFGPNTVLHGVSFEVKRGEIAGIFGLNGAGKSVTLKVVCGLLQPWSGHVALEGREVTRLEPEDRVRAGVGNLPQGRQVFGDLTVEQNLRLGAYTTRRQNRKAYAQQLDEMYTRFPVLGRRRRQLAGTMSGGEQASLAVARALMSRPKLLLVDEPSAGLAPKVVEELFETLRQVNQSGVTILLVEQNVTFGLKLVDTAHVMQRGRIVYQGPVATLGRSRLAAYLGVGRLLGQALDGKTAAATGKKTRARVEGGKSA